MNGLFAELVKKIKAAESVWSVDVFRKLLWAEGWRLGIPRSRIHVPSQRDCSDGGIDARVDEGAFTGESNVIFTGQTRYQIKTGQTFKPWQNSVVQKELFGKEKGKTRSPSKQNLKPGIRGCLDAGGTYVMVCFGHDFEKNRDTTENVVRTLLNQCGYESPDIRIWGTSDIAGFIEPHRGLCRDVLGLLDEAFHSHESWSRQGEMQRPLKLDDAQGEFVKLIQRELREGHARHIRVCGEPGIGKTRLVLEATRDEDLASAVVYWPLAEDFLKSKFYSQLIHGDVTYPAILILDECSPKVRANISDDLRSDDLRLITIYHEFEVTSGSGVVYPEVPPLDESHIAAIISTYDVPDHLARHFADLCSGSPRVAHVVGENLREQSGDLTASPPTMQDVWNRYVTGGDTEREPVRVRKLVLTYLALFKRFGFGMPVEKEAKAIARMIQAADPQVTWDRFQQEVRELRERKILQGGTTLYITPKLLHIWLWREWWDTHEAGLDIQHFVKDLPGPLFDWFAEMFKYAEESQAATKQVDQLLGPDGPFQQSDFLQTEVGARFFFSLAEARPASALRCLEGTIGNQTCEELRQFTNGRQYVIDVLEKIAFLRELFVRAARLLLILGEAENEIWTNNASGVFTELFSPGPGGVAPTEASPEERFPVLVEALESASPKRRSLGLRACRIALHAGSFHRLVGAEYRGLGRVANPWTPQTPSEMRDAYRRVWEFLRSAPATFTEDESAEAKSILIDQGAELVVDSELAQLVLLTFEQFAIDNEVPTKQLVATLVRIIQFSADEMDEATVSQFKQLKEKLSGSDYSSRLHRYVGMVIWDERMEEEDKQSIHRELCQLAQAATRNPQLLRPEFEWLMSDEAEDAYSFGVELAKHDPEKTWLGEIVEAQRNARVGGNTGFISGYLAIVKEDSPQRWETLLDRLADDSVLAEKVPAITHRSGFSERAARRVLSIVQAGKASPLEFGHWCWGNQAAEIAEPIFRQWIDELLKHSSQARAGSIALKLTRIHYCAEEAALIPGELAHAVLLNDCLFSTASNGEVNLGNTGRDWTMVAEQFLADHPDQRICLLSGVLERWTESGTFLDSGQNKSQSVLDEIVRKSPVDSWHCIAGYLDDLRSRRSRLVMKWLQGERYSFGNDQTGVISVIPQDDLFSWTEEFENERAEFLAGYLPKTLNTNAGGRLTRAFLARFGDRADVRSAIFRNFETGIWSGPTSEHLLRKIEVAKRWLDEEKNDNVRRWLTEYISSLESRLEDELVQEEREG